MIAYYKLLDMLNRKGMTREDLRKGIKCSSATITKISKNEYISMANLEEICKFLDCQPSDLIEYISDEKL